MRITKSFAPSGLADWRNWLVQNHDREQEVWLIYRKATRGKTNIDYESSVEEALCFGWTLAPAQVRCRQHHSEGRPGKLCPQVQPYRRNYILWLSDAKKSETFEHRLQVMIEEVLAGKPASMH